VHSPIALAVAAAAAELVAIATPRQAGHTVAVANLRAGAAKGVVTAVTGWVLAGHGRCGARAWRSAGVFASGGFDEGHLVGRIIH
jgi:uncharacterized membrane protein